MTKQIIEADLMRRLGCLTPLGLFAGLLTLLIVGGVALASGGAMFSPGELNAHAGESLGGVTSHAQLSDRCAACHVDPWSSEVMATRCLSCHTDVRAQLDNPQSLHSAMPDVKQCRSCHAEHNGSTASLLRLNLTDFPHDRLPFTLAAH
ncbi:MAG: cytochrome c3 family protein [Chloroflexi bacterium]|nr:cytochrome c3 family protein [Chloroflexota bacterium]